MPLKDLDARKAYEREYYENIGRHHYEANKEKFAEQSKKWDAAHRELRRERAALRRATDPEGIKAASRRHYHKNGWNWFLQKRYGVNQKEYDELLARQGGVCAICKKRCKRNRRLSVDHDHNTGKVRGLLCDRCNKGIGFFNDSPEQLAVAIAYLQVVPHSS